MIFETWTLSTDLKNEILFHFPIKKKTMTSLHILCTALKHEANNH